MCLGLDDQQTELRVSVASGRPSRFPQGGVGGTPFFSTLPPGIPSRQDREGPRGLWQARLAQVGDGAGVS